MEAGRVYMWGGLGKCYLPFLSLINVKNNGALVARQPHSTWFWFTAWGEGTACSKLKHQNEPPPSFTTSQRPPSPQRPAARPQPQQFYWMAVIKIKEREYIFKDYRVNMKKWM